ncbi:hypothetical protein FOFC_08152, partial [Fusarium oxysporum]
MSSRGILLIGQRIQDVRMFSERQPSQHRHGQECTNALDVSAVEVDHDRGYYLVSATKRESLPFRCPPVDLFPYQADDTFWQTNTGTMRGRGLVPSLSPAYLPPSSASCSQRANHYRTPQVAVTFRPPGASPCSYTAGTCIRIPTPQDSDPAADLA